MLRTTTRRYFQNRLRYLASFHWRAMLRKATLCQLLQAIHAVIEWKLHRTRCSSRPFAFRIEPAATCNLRCPLCSTTYRKFHPSDVRVMTLDLFRTILDKIRKHAWRITFYMEGEPMMNPQLFEMIELSTRERHLFTSFSTNLTLMRTPLLGPLFQSRIDWISVSLDGFRQATYETYRVNGRVRHVLDGIAMIMTWRMRNRVPYPYIQVNMIDFFHISAEERKQVENFCAAQGVDEFRVRPEQFGLMGRYNPTTARELPSKCHWPWISMSIDCDGSVYPCPIGFEQRISYGNLATSSLKEIWNNELYVATRAYLSRNEDVCQSPAKLPCYNCRWYGKHPATTDAIATRKQWLQAAQSG
jgi:radical SAM protein with 4Fe4S-binding SPASM domain